MMEWKKKRKSAKKLLIDNEGNRAQQTMKEKCKGPYLLYMGSALVWFGVFRCIALVVGYMVHGCGSPGFFTVAETALSGT